MGSHSNPVEIFFFPFVGGGHQIPIIDMARVFASHGAKTTIIATPKHALSFQKSIDRNKKSGLPIAVHTLSLPENAEISNTDMSAGPFTDTSMLKEPLQNLLRERKPDCIIHDVFHRWSADAIDSLGVTRITFNGNACFSRCVFHNIDKYKPHEKLGSDLEPFVVPGLPHRIELTNSQLPFFARLNQGQKGMQKFDDNKAFGVALNSVYELEPDYAEFFKNELNNNRTWLVGPVSLCNRNAEDKAERGQKTSVDEQSILSWLDRQQPDSVLYISFGSAARLAARQLKEIAHGLEAANHPFIWVIGKVFKSADEQEDDFLPGGFENRIQESKKGFVIRGWAPQLLILEHVAVGGFLSHCGWNSTLEAVSAGLPMITWPISAEQFVNEKLIVDVWKMGVKAGCMEWLTWDMEPRSDVGREKVEEAVKRLMGDGEEAAEMRRKAKVLGEKAKKAVEEGGSSFKAVEALIQELKSRRSN